MFQAAGGGGDPRAAVTYTGKPRAESLGCGIGSRWPGRPDVRRDALPLPGDRGLRSVGGLRGAATGEAILLPFNEIRISRRRRWGNQTDPRFSRESPVPCGQV
jgi:hypothetical protein